MTRTIRAELLSEREYDAIIIGTGLTESILAAALASSGSSVLHIDANHFYGATWATLNLSHLEKIITEAASSTGATENGLQLDSLSAAINSEIETIFGANYEACVIPQLPFHRYAFPNGLRVLVDSSSSQLETTEASLDKNRIWLDLVPRPIMAAGSMIDLLIQTNVGHYIDFRALDALYVEFGDSGGMQRVPSTRSDVFQNRFISMIEKRLLMRFVKNCIEQDDQLPEDSNGDELKSFEQAIVDAGLTENLRRFLTHSIAFCDGNSTLSSRDGINAVRRYQESMFKFGTPTPFLYSNYGSGELPQAFCRLCAVKGGVYVLRRGAKAVIRKKRSGIEGSQMDGNPESQNSVGVVTTENEVVKSKHVFISSQHLNEMKEGPQAPDSGAHRVWRFMAVLRGSITCDKSSNRIMLTVPRETFGNVSSAVRIRQLDSSVLVCPLPYFVLYAETIDSDGTEEDLMAVVRNYVHIGGGEDISENMESMSLETAINENEPVAQALNGVNTTEGKKPTMLWGITYSRDVQLKSDSGLDGRIVAVMAPEVEHDADHVIREARRCFAKVKAEKEFFPSTGIEQVSEGSDSEAQATVEQ